MIRDALYEAIDALGGYHADVFGIEDVGERLVSIHSKLGAHNLNLEAAQKQCVKVEKIQELVVNEHSTVRDLNIAVLMTHWDYIAPVYFLRYITYVREGCKIENRSNLGHCPNRREGGPKDCSNVPTLISKLKCNMKCIQIVRLYH